MSKKPAELILVADDDALSRKLLVRILSSAGFACVEASDGIEALKSLRGAPRLPSCSWTSTCRE